MFEAKWLLFYLLDVTLKKLFKGTLRHLSSFDRDDKMGLNQIKFCRSAGGVKHSHFSLRTVKPTLGVKLGKKFI